MLPLNPLTRKALSAICASLPGSQPVRPVDQSRQLFLLIQLPGRFVACKWPSASNFSGAAATITSGLVQGQHLQWKTNIWRKWYCARAVPSVPTVAPMIATGLPFQALSP